MNRGMTGANPPCRGDESKLRPRTVQPTGTCRSGRRTAQQAGESRLGPRRPGTCAVPHRRRRPARHKTQRGHRRSPGQESRQRANPLPSRLGNSPTGLKPPPASEHHRGANEPRQRDREGPRLAPGRRRQCLAGRSGRVPQVFPATVWRCVGVCREDWTGVRGGLENVGTDRGRRAQGPSTFRPQAVRHRRRCQPFRRQKRRKRQTEGD